MTTVAYKDGVMASDSLLTLGSQRMGSVQKVWKFDSGALYGARGDGDDRALRELLEDVTDESRMPRASDLEAITAEIDALFVLPDGIVFHISTAGAAQALRVGAPYHAIGSGYKYALGAMADGATAERAVIAASKHDGHTGGDVQVVQTTKPFVPSGVYFHGVPVDEKCIGMIRPEDFLNGMAKRTPTSKFYPMYTEEKYLHHEPATC